MKIHCIKVAAFTSKINKFIGHKGCGSNLVGGGKLPYAPTGIQVDRMKHMVIGTYEDMPFRNARRGTDRPTGIVGPYQLARPRVDDMQAFVLGAKKKTIFIGGRPRYHAAIRWIFPLEFSSAAFRA